MTSERIAELRALAKAATPGPYRADDGDVLCPDDNTAPAGYSSLVYLADCDARRADARFIAAACNAVPELLDERDALRTENERLREALHAVAREAGLSRGDAAFVVLSAALSAKPPREPEAVWQDTRAHSIARVGACALSAVGEDHGWVANVSRLDDTLAVKSRFHPDRDTAKARAVELYRAVRHLVRDAEKDGT